MADQPNRNVFELGLTAFKEWGNIQEAIRLAQPVLDEYNNHKEVVNDLRDIMDRLDKVKLQVIPILSAYQEVDDKLVPLLAHLSNAFFPNEVRQKSREVPMPKDGFNTAWLQKSLIDLAKAGKFTWPAVNRHNKPISQSTFVDDDYGPNTADVVKCYQQRQVDDKVPGWKASKNPGENDVDGWAGLKTCSRMYTDLGTI